MKTLTVGVTGHRKINEFSYPEVIKQVNDFFKRIIDSYPGHRIQLKSPLAEGADQLSAQSASKYGIELIVPLPFKAEEYIHDFSNKKIVRQFYDLRNHAKEVYVPEICREAPDRTESYYRVGAYVALTSDILLALWDQRPDLEKRGGTAHIIREQFEGFPTTITEMIEAKKERMTYVIYSPRSQGRPSILKNGYWTRDDYIEFIRDW